MPVWPQSISFRDVKGKTSWLRLFVTAADLNTAQSLVATFWLPGTAGCSNAAQVNWIGPRTKPPAAVTYGTGTRFKDCEDKLRCWVATAAGTVHIVDIPAPFASMFLADGETVNPADSRIVTLVDVLTNRGMCDRDGHLFTAFLAGLHVRITLRRKAGLYVLNPQLTTTVL